MKTNLALLAGGIIALVPMTTAAAQPAPQSTGAAQDTAAKSAPAKPADSACDATAKGKAPDSTPHASAKVGKDTGELPPPRKKPDTACSTEKQSQPDNQPQ